MDLLADPELRPLLDQAVDGELDIPVGTGLLRVDLKGDNIRLWQETLDRLQPEVNLLLACENSDGNLDTTQLTWVVGAAIRAAQVSSSAEAGSLLNSLGIESALSDAEQNQQCQSRTTHGASACGLRGGAERRWYRG